MTTPDGSISGNPMRDAAILAAVREIAEQQTPSYDKVAAFLRAQDLEGFGELLREEFSEAFAIYADHHASGFDPPSTPEPDAPAVQAAPIEEAPKAPAMSPEEIDEARENLRLAQVDLANARAAVIGETNRRLTAQGKLDDAKNAWARGLPRLTPEQNARQYIAGQLAEKQAKKDAGIPPQMKRVANSYIDRARAHRTGGDGNDYARGRMQRGYNNGRFTRGDVMDAQGRIVRPELVTKQEA